MIFKHENFVAKLLFNSKYLAFLCAGQTSFVKGSTEGRKRKFPAVSCGSGTQGTKRMLGEEYAGK